MINITQSAIFDFSKRFNNSEMNFFNKFNQEYV